MYGETSRGNGPKEHFPNHSYYKLNVQLGDRSNLMVGLLTSIIKGATKRGICLLKSFEVSGRELF